MSDTDRPSSEPSRRGRWQFGLRALLVLMLLASVLAAVFGGAFRGSLPRPVFVVLVMAAPLGVLLILSVLGQVFQWIGQHRRR